MEQTIFMTKVRTDLGKRIVSLLIESIRCFGGEMANCPIWVFDTGPQDLSAQSLIHPDARVIPLVVPNHLKEYEFGEKVYACAYAEEMAPGSVQSLIWIDPTCLVVNPPVLYDLSGGIDAAVRPVHIRNLGLRVTDPLNPYWQRVYEAVGVKDLETTVESFADQERIRSYFNSHAFSINPGRSLLHRWLEIFEKLIEDQEFQANACQDENHQVYLHQAVLSTIIAASLKPGKLRILPPEYNYPYHLHTTLPAGRRVKSLNDLVTVAYEDWPMLPADVQDIEIQEPLKSWLAGKVE